MRRKEIGLYCRRLLGAVAAMLWVASVARAEPSGNLTIFHAGSLSVPMKEMADAFEARYPGVTVQRESAGSRACARKISDLHKPCDVIASADYTVINELLIPEYADWNIKFAANEMSIVYHDGSRHADAINADNWARILMADDVAFGRADPNTDPCGYRSVLVMRLAEQYYKAPGLADRMLKKDLRYMRPKEVDLLALLESHVIDYIFLYRSVAHQHGLKYVVLPDPINLKNPDHADYYKQATVEVSGKQPGETITKIGAPIIYGISIPKNPPNPEAALAFVQFLLDADKGMKIIVDNGQSSVVPAVAETYDKIPAELKKFAKPVPAEPEKPE